ncbi:hypothetical protein KP509_38G037500 [Ceratopteris richardii]|uniref:Uncharacterized protein n=1 Tax=Ceratopteris richardii TaxID=49495 RepID=A0A8T2Q427_CERRI|nr:hypothetical protein KP509_38G037500 [Ceratopteris richardii]
MDRKKKREKVSANGITLDGSSGQLEDTHGGWQREYEQLGPAKRLTSGATSDSPSTVPPFNLLFAQHPSVPQQSAQTLGPQPAHGLAGTPQQPFQALSGAPQGCPSGLGGWPSGDAFPQNVNVLVHPPFQPGMNESTWPHPPAPGVQALGGRPPPFLFPPPSYAGYGGGYMCPLPSIPQAGASHRGIIRPPPGLSQKHMRLWEAQSMENMQLWSTTTQLWAAVTRCDSEIALQRAKIIKLEAELQAMKAHHDGNMPQSDITPLQSCSKRGRRKKTLPVPMVLTVNSSACDGDIPHVPAKRTRVISSKVDTPKIKEMEPEEKDKSNVSMAEPVSKPLADEHDQKSSLTVSSLRAETAPQKHSIRQTLEFQNSTNSSLPINKEDTTFSHINHLNSPFRLNNVTSSKKDSHYQHFVRESTTVSFLKTGSSLDHQNIFTSEMSYVTTPNGGGLCPESTGNIITKDAVVRSQLHAHLNAHTMQPNPNDLSKTWEYAGDDGSDEQDDGCASMQDDDDGDYVDDEDGETVLDDMQHEKAEHFW